jgi:hypothetical protein
MIIIWYVICLKAATIAVSNLELFENNFMYIEMVYSGEAPPI